MKETHGLTVKELELLRQVINRVWDTIYVDILVDENYQYDESVTVTNYEVAADCLDADRWMDFTDVIKFEPVMQKLRDMGFGSTEWKEVIDMALPYKTYGS